MKNQINIFLMFLRKTAFKLCRSALKENEQTGLEFPWALHKFVIVSMGCTNLYSIPLGKTGGQFYSLQ